MAIIKISSSEDIFPEARYGLKADLNAAATAISAKSVKYCVVSVNEYAPDNSARAR